MWEFCDGLLQRGHVLRILTADVPELMRDPYPGYERVEQHVKRTLQLFGSWEKGNARTLEDMGAIQQIALHDYREILGEVSAFQPDICIAGNLDFLSGAMLDPILKQGIPIIHRLGNANPGYAADAVPQSELFCIAGCSSWVNTQLEQRDYHPRNFAVLPPGSPLEDYFQAELPQRDTLRICFAGLVTAFKGVHLLLEALGMLKHQGVSFTCEIAGELKDPDYRKLLLQLIADYDLGAHVKLLGFCNRQQLAAMYARSNVLVMPSVFDEPFGKVQIEAQAAGLAVVRSAVGGYKDMLEDEVNGLLFKPNDAEDLARQLYVLQGDKELWAKIAAQGQVDAFKFSTPQCVQILEEIMEALIATAK